MTRACAQHPRSELRIRLLVELELELDGVPLSTALGARERELLCFLALEPGPHLRGELAARFRPDVLEERSRASLRTALCGLRRALGSAKRHLLVERERIGLDAAWVDVREVESAARQGRVEEALALCRGELVAEIGSEWALQARDRHRDLLVDLYERRARAAEAAGDLDAALRATRAQVAAEPLSEQATRRLIERLLAAGDRAAALAAYQRLEESLDRELGVLPAPPTRRLAAQIRLGRATRAGSAAEPADAPLESLDEALRTYADALGAVASAVELLGGEGAGGSAVARRHIARAFPELVGGRGGRDPGTAQVARVLAAAVPG